MFPLANNFSWSLYHDHRIMIMLVIFQNRACNLLTTVNIGYTTALNYHSRRVNKLHKMYYYC